MLKKQTSIMKQDKYYVYVNLNSPIEEDFVFLLTGLYHWEQQNPGYMAKHLVKDYDLICVDPPKEAKVEVNLDKLKDEKTRKEQKDAIRAIAKAAA
jgi:hypothetical protein